MKSPASSKKPAKPLKPRRHNFAPTSYGPNADEDLEALLARFKIDQWDYLLIGDGSGCAHDEPCGWGCAVIARRKQQRHVLWGMMNKGTVNMAEMLAYIQALNFLAACDEEQWKKSGKRRFRHVHIITDSDYCRSQGSSGNLSPKRNGALWRIFEDFQRRGLILYWHHAKRTNVAMNVYADALSKSARELPRLYAVQRTVERDASGTTVRSVYDINQG